MDFTIEDVGGYVEDDGRKSPPYYISDQKGNPIWFLEQDNLEPSDPKQRINNEVWIRDDGPVPVVCEGSGSSCICSDESELEDGKVVCHDDRTNKKTTLEVTRDFPSPGRFKFAHEVKSKPEKYLDYLYLQNGGLSFKVNEESQSFSDAMSAIPPFSVDEMIKNKIQDLNDVQVMQEHSTFIHQGENPSEVKDSTSFNPLYVNAILNRGLEQREDLGSDGVPMVICVD